MIRNIIILLFTLFLSPIHALADEGMWLLPLLESQSKTNLNRLGVELNTRKIYQDSLPSLKDAVVIFGSGCTGEIISDQGLILTNYHCAFDDIQSISSLSKNYIKEGFWASSLGDEIPIKDLTITFLNKMEDVTTRVLKGVSKNTPAKERRYIVSSNIAEIKEKYEVVANDKVEVKSFFEDNHYYLMHYTIYSDIRLVGAPPTSIGQFGDETDNWHWPRHTGDFSLFRVYCKPDGSPNTFAPENIPLKPKQFLSISTQGVKENDVTLTLGYPGSTSRYITSFGINERTEIINQSKIKARGSKLKIWQEHMLEDKKLALQYASKLSSARNYYQNSVWMNTQIEQQNIIAKREKQQIEFNDYYKNDTLYGTLLTSLESAYLSRRENENAYYFMRECFTRGSEIFAFAYKSRLLATYLRDQNTTAADEQLAQLKYDAHEFYANYSPILDKEVTTSLMVLYKNEIPEAYHPQFLRKLNSTQAITKFVNRLFKKSIFASEEQFLKFLEHPKSQKLIYDAIYQTSVSIYTRYKEILFTHRSYSNRINDLNRIYLNGLTLMYPNQLFYPDANFTMRLSYGTIGGYSPGDATHYDAFTSLKGVMEKEIPNNVEFHVPEKLKTLYQTKDYGTYAKEDSIMPVCFISNNDITGGNSGSPVLNKKGELIGLAFDGNWEALSSDIEYQPEIQKCICVDIRYILFLIDKYANAQNIIQEIKQCQPNTN